MTEQLSTYIQCIYILFVLLLLFLKKLLIYLPVLGLSSRDGIRLFHTGPSSVIVL